MLNPTMTPREHLARCIRRCARHKDGRGPWQAEKACAEALGGSTIDRMAAAAARRVGLFIAGRQA